MSTQVSRENGTPWQELTLKLKTNLIFIAVATVVILIIAWLDKNQGLPIDLEIETLGSPAKNYWHQWMALSGLGIPLVILILKRKNPLIQSIFIPYLSVLGVQIITELLLLPAFGKGISVIIGTIYSLFRLVQLSQAQKFVDLKKRTNLNLKFFLLFLFGIWAINLLRLLLLRWPALLAN